MVGIMDDEIIIVVCDDIVVSEKKVEDEQYLGQLWNKETYPDDYDLCKIGFNLAKKCLEIHQRGMIIANEWNESNVLIDVKKQYFNRQVLCNRFHAGILSWNKWLSAT